MKVIVPALDDNSTAHLALEAEGVKHTVYTMQSEYDYGELLRKCWLEQEGFIVVEHDIVPWPTALEQLDTCPCQYCGYNYPVANTRQMGAALGCTKFSTGLIRLLPNLADYWHTCPWQHLDAEVIRSVVWAVGSMHHHYPPVAHARRPR